MQLLSVAAEGREGEEDLNRSLDIVPMKFGNIGRFFNGINNSETESKTLKQNLKTMRVQLNNECKVLMYTCRKVRKNEKLLFDYNEGVLSQGKDILLYDTTAFV